MIYKNGQRLLSTGGDTELDEGLSQIVRRELEEVPDVCVPLAASTFSALVTETVAPADGLTDVALWYAVKGDRAAASALRRHGVRRLAKALLYRSRRTPLRPASGAFTNKVGGLREQA